MNKLAALGATSLTLIGLYLVLRFAGGASQILGALSVGTVNIFKTLQAR